MSTYTFQRQLSTGWYPDTVEEIRNTFIGWQKTHSKEKVISCIVPHAGWFYSGEIAFNVFDSIDCAPDTVVIAGGHLLPVNAPVLWEYHEYDTPLGAIKCDIELLSILKEGINYQPVLSGDNSIEVQLPFIRHFFPHSRLVCLQVPPSIQACDVVNALYSYIQETGKKILVVASADLTHYGPNYHFVVHESTQEAVSWVKEINDFEIIQYALDCNTDRILKHGVEHKSTCSGGAIAVAAEFARKNRCDSSELIEYYTSYDISPSSSFVGYAGIRYY